MHIWDNKGVIIKEPEIDFIIKHNESLPEHTVKNKISQILLKNKHGN